MSKKKKNIEELLEEAVVPDEEQPYEVPENWVWTKLECVFEQVKEQIQPTGNEKYIGLEHMNKGGGILEVGNTEGVKSKKVVFKKNDVLYGKLRPYLNKHAHVEFDGVASTDILVYRNKNISTNKLLNMYLGLPQVLQYANENSNGINLPRVSPKAMDNMHFPLPPLSEQKRIADKVELLLSKIEEAKHLIEEAKETFDLRRAAILDKAFRGELTKKWRQQNLSVDSAAQRLEMIKKERFQIAETKREVSELIEMFDELNIVECINNNDWLCIKANMFCYNINCGGTPSKDISEEGEIPFLKVYNIVNNKVDFSYKPQYIPKEVHKSKLKKSMLRPNDVIMNIVGPPLKKIAIIPEEYSEMNMNQAIVRFRPIKYVLPKYLYYCLQYDETLRDVINETRGVVGQSNISVSQSRNLVMPIPSIEEQAEIVSILEEMIKREEIVLSLVSDEKNLDELKQSILSKAFRGELGTNDPSEESAIELLKEVLQEQVK
ncbi:MULTISPECIES: restriction endonuclease subunit S [Bacillus amyloliquefaciens group]|uniref:restriction endonuclease subunit S n=1 Tax=Bacillus amyloliquefaciens group TaxID=1938374 RepID=UPI001C9DF93C|nr:restriction endonuclease subunit S [Bacillus amyloliquefaciens]QZT39836.1 restriction endonuclease subunit S [Bacillus amyloliquefaciens]